MNLMRSLTSMFLIMVQIMFKKPQEEGTEPRIKDFHMDAEHRKYLFSEEYCTGVAGAVPEMTVKEYALLQEQQKLLLLQQQRRSRSKTPPQVFANKDGITSGQFDKMIKTF